MVSNCLDLPSVSRPLFSRKHATADVCQGPKYVFIRPKYALANH